MQSFGAKRNVLRLAIEDACISKLLRDAACRLRPGKLLCGLKTLPTYLSKDFSSHPQRQVFLSVSGLHICVKTEKEAFAVVASQSFRAERSDYGKCVCVSRLTN